MSRGLAARTLAHAILERVEATDAFADVLLAERLGTHTGDERDAALVTRLVYGTLAWQARLDHHLSASLRTPLRKLDPAVRAALRLGAFQLLLLDRIPPFAAIDTSVEITRRAGARRATGLVNAVLRRVAAAGLHGVPLPDAMADPIGRLAVEWSHPRWLVERWHREFGPVDLPALLAANNEAAPTTLRTNPRRTRPTDLAHLLRSDDFEVAPGRWAQQALAIDGGAARLRGHRTFREGLFSFQGEASQLVDALLGSASVMTVLDACAAPGGKSLAIAERWPDARVVALDPQPKGLRSLTADAARLGVSVTPVVADARRPPLSGRFDAVLVDAPCSGLGTLRRHPELRWRREAADLDRLARLQGAILDGVAAHVAPGGVLVFAVCTLSAAENEEQVHGFLKHHDGFDVEHAATVLPPNVHVLVTAEGFLRTLPHRHGLDGFFAARLRRRRLDSGTGLR